LGMTPSKVWTGIYDATGGYLIVKENGEKKLCAIDNYLSSLIEISLSELKVYLSLSLFFT